MNAGDTGHASIQTFTGRFVKPYELTAADVDVRDIAHALSNVCRFQGHVREFYSVAQHSVLCASLNPTLPTLLHDATEAYACDLAGPLKRDTELGRMYKGVERLIARAIEEAFSLEPDALEARDVKRADWAMLQVEGRQLMPANDWARVDILTDMRIKPWLPRDAERAFLETFGVLCA